MLSSFSIPSSITSCWLLATSVSSSSLVSLASALDTSSPKSNEAKSSEILHVADVIVASVVAAILPANSGVSSDEDASKLLYVVTVDDAVVLVDTV